MPRLCGLPSGPRLSLPIWRRAIVLWRFWHHRRCNAQIRPQNYLFHKSYVGIILAYCRQEEWEVSVVSVFWKGGFGSRSFHLVFRSVLIKIYLSKPYTIRKILLSSFRVFSSFLLWVSFLRRYFILQNRLNSVWRVPGGPKYYFGRIWELSLTAIVAYMRPLF